MESIEQAPRLETLDGKTIAIVGGSFMAYVTHPELKRLILEKYPTAKVLVLSEVGSAGPWPRPGVVRPEKRSVSEEAEGIEDRRRHFRKRRLRSLHAEGNGVVHRGGESGDPVRHDRGARFRDAGALRCRDCRSPRSACGGVSRCVRFAFA